jgi:hypothetical protein
MTRLIEDLKDDSFPVSHWKTQFSTTVLVTAATREGALSVRMLLQLNAREKPGRPQDLFFNRGPT